MDTPMQAKTVRLDASCFSIRKEGRSLPFHTMVSTSQTPDFYSPSAQNLNTPHADVVLVSVSTTENELNGCMSNFAFPKTSSLNPTTT
jgi:hypothetical protein